MQRIDTLNRALALFGVGKDGFKDGNQAAGINPTEFDAGWCNAVQEELAGVIEATGVALDPNNRAQLYAAIQKLIEMRVGDYALDTGTANAKVVALNPALAAYATNFDGAFKNAVANTGPCTVNFGPSAVALVRDDGTALAGGDLTAGMLVYYTYVLADNKAYVTSMVQSQGDARYLLQTNPNTGLVETFGPPGGALNRRYVDVVNITGMQYNAANINAEYMTVNNTSYNTGTGTWAGRDAAGPCYAEVMTDAGQKLYFYAPTAAAGVAPVWSLLFWFDLTNGSFAGIGGNQTLQNVAASRALAITYYNTTSKPIVVFVTTLGTNYYASLVINGVTCQWQNTGATGIYLTFCGIVFPGEGYSIAGNATSVGYWVERR